MLFWRWITEPFQFWQDGSVITQLRLYYKSCEGLWPWKRIWNFLNPRRAVRFSNEASGLKAVCPYLCLWIQGLMNIQFNLNKSDVLDSSSNTEFKQNNIRSHTLEWCFHMNSLVSTALEFRVGSVSSSERYS